MNDPAQKLLDQAIALSRCGDRRGAIKAYQRLLARRPDLPDIAGLSVGDMRSYLAARQREGLNAASRARALSALKSLFGFLEREGLAETSRPDKSRPFPQYPASPPAQDQVSSYSAR